MGTQSWSNTCFWSELVSNTYWNVYCVGLRCPALYNWENCNKSTNKKHSTPTHFTAISVTPLKIGTVTPENLNLPEVRACPRVPCYTRVLKPSHSEVYSCSLPFRARTRKELRYTDAWVSDLVLKGSPRVRKRRWDEEQSFSSSMSLSCSHTGRRRVFICNKRPRSTPVHHFCCDWIVASRLRMLGYQFAREIRLGSLYPYCRMLLRALLDLSNTGTPRQNQKPLAGLVRG
jgi:hypothetical protein